MLKAEGRHQIHFEHSFKGIVSCKLLPLFVDTKNSIHGPLCSGSFAPYVSPTTVGVGGGGGVNLTVPLCQFEFKNLFLATLNKDSSYEI